MNKIYIILLILIVAIIYLYSENKCVKESMANTEENLDEKIKNHVSNIYKADIKAIQNLANISTELQNGSLKIPGNLTIDGDLVVNKNSNVKGQTTINALYGGKSIHGGWRDIIVNGGHLRFVVGQNKFGFHSSDSGLYYYKNNSEQKLPIAKGIHAKGHVHIDDHLSTRRIDVRNDKGKGTTHFNYAHSGDNYIRGDLKDKLTKDGKNILKKGDKVRLQSHGGWWSKYNKHGRSAHYGLHMAGDRHAVAWGGGDLFALE